MLTKDIRETLEQIEDWELKEKGFEAIAGGFEKTYGQAKRAMAAASKKHATLEDFHEGRKRVKYHWYHCRLLQNLWKPLVKARCDEAKHLAELLGEDRDAALLDRLLEQSASQFPDAAEALAFRDIIAKAQRKLRQEAFLIGERLFAGKAKFLSGQFGSWWSAWRSAA
jgi:CHAD domain-containing protein